MTNRRTYTHYSPPSTPFSFTHDMLLTYLYRRNESNGPSALRKTGDKSVKRGNSRTIFKPSPFLREVNL